MKELDLITWESFIKSDHKSHVILTGNLVPLTISIKELGDHSALPVFTGNYPNLPILDSDLHRSMLNPSLCLILFQ